MALSGVLLNTGSRLLGCGVDRRLVGNPKPIGRKGLVNNCLSIRAEHNAVHALAIQAEPAVNVKQVFSEKLPSIAGGSFENDATSFWEEHRVRAYEVGPDQKATIVTIANLLQVGINLLRSPFKVIFS